MPSTPETTATDQARKQYRSSVMEWSAYMLKILRYIPNKAGKLALLRQVDKVKSRDIMVNDLPAYAAALAILSEKSASLMRGKEPDSEVTVEKAMSCLKSGLIKNKLRRDQEGSFVLLTEYLKL